MVAAILITLLILTNVAWFLAWVELRASRDRNARWLELATGDYQQARNEYWAVRHQLAAVCRDIGHERANRIIREAA